MNKLYTLTAALCLTGTLAAQSKIGLNPKSFRVTEKEIPSMNESVVKTYSSKALQNLKKNAFFSEDFSNGFEGQGSNGQWTQQGTPSIATGVIPEWEYRGPNTDPDNTVGSRGSCAGTRGPIQSETADNGFMIFDSNYWDEPLPDDCAGSGSGLSPRPHQSALISPSIDLSGQQEVQLFFTTFSRNFQASVNLSVIADGDTTLIVNIYDFLDLPVNTQTSDNQIVGIDISEAAGGKSDVKIMWDFVGDYYYFSMDDVFLDEIPDYDYNIEEIYSDDITDFYEYYDLPISQTHLLSPGMIVNSRGTEPVDLELQISITDPDGEIQGPFTQVLGNFPKDSVSEIVYIPTFTPSKLGQHIINYKLTTPNDSDDLNFANNEFQRAFNITEFKWSDVFSRNKAFSFFAPSIDGAPGESEAFQTFYTYSDVMITSIDYTITNDDRRPDEQTFFGDEVELAVYLIDKDAFQATLESGGTILKSELFTKLESVFVEVEDDMLGVNPDFVENTLSLLELGAPVEIAEDNLFAISLYNSGGGYLSITTNSPNENTDGSGLTRARGLLADPAAAPDDQIFLFNNVSPWLRAGVDEKIGINERNTLDAGLSIYPNPSENFTNVSFTLKQSSDVNIEVKNVLGQVVFSQNEEQLNSGTHVSKLNTEGLNEGVYFVSISVNNKIQTKKLVVQK